MVSTSTNDVVGQTHGKERASWSDVLKISGELIHAVERSVIASGKNFDSLFHAVRLELADDFGFFDPFAAGFQYSNAVVTLAEPAPISAYVIGLSEALRRVASELIPAVREEVARRRASS